MLRTAESQKIFTKDEFRRQFERYLPTLRPKVTKGWNQKLTCASRTRIIHFPERPEVLKAGCSIQMQRAIVKIGVLVSSIYIIQSKFSVEPITFGTLVKSIQTKLHSRNRSMVTMLFAVSQICEYRLKFHHSKSQYRAKSFHVDQINAMGMFRGPN